ncbi:MAG: hypothetical protein A3E78_05265 [Alphaproteobacteria bacterium RIFCSPHIGHO2_12_FULL_63_12]|nr:MAG: hypothetical protein A3E78_05265 [Alphaproteobacteria bacterium RIFCSPHIGHO2_12_FULL_63_12]
MDGTEAVSSYRDLLVWQRAMDLAEHCYLATRNFPREETYGLTSQIRRSASSEAANIAEGYGRNSSGAYVQFLKNAQGSVKELETHLILSRRVGMLGAELETAVLARTDEVGRMLRSLIRSIQKSASS